MTRLVGYDRMEIGGEDMNSVEKEMLAIFDRVEKGDAARRAAKRADAKRAPRSKRAAGPGDWRLPASVRSTRPDSSPPPGGEVGFLPRR